MRLSDLLKNVPVLASEGDSEREIEDFEFDSRRVEKGHLFIAVSGTQVDGHAFIDKAIAKGATAILSEKWPTQRPEGVSFIRVENSQRELARVAANFYGNPAGKLRMVGITGTNGKTTSATLMYQLFQQLGIKSGLLSTIRNQIGQEEKPATHTTPDPKQLHGFLAEMWQAGCVYCFMEVSSHALVQHRVTGIPFHLALFTNLTHDHLDYHGSFDEYIRAKKLLFDYLPKGSTALVNADEKHSSVMVQNTQAKVKRYALKRMADYRARILENSFAGLQLEVNGKEAWFQLRGSFNAYNLLMVYAAAVELGEDPQEILQVLSGFGGVEGRFEVFQQPERKLTAIVDYAHTPDALKNVLQTIQNINQGQGQLITVVGCGGNRDKAKRPKMGKLAATFSDQVILTSDNPRFENPQEILSEIYAGIEVPLRKKVLQIENRREAIRTACQLASPGDIILVAGKGHETYQEIKGVKHPFDDREIIRESFT